jgi:hypothetical protein
MMEAHLGVPVVQHDDGSRPSMYDLRVEYGDGRTAAAEVTCELDPSVRELGKLLTARPGVWTVPGLRGGWLVGLLPSARAKRLFAELPGLLVSLEAAGVRGLDLMFDQDTDDPHVHAAHRLGVVGLEQHPTDHPGSVYPMILMTGSRGGGLLVHAADATAEWIGPYIAEERADVLAKLARSDASERHAFVVIAGLSEPSFAVFDPLVRMDVELPSCPPDLPDEVTHVWVTTTWEGGRGLAWSPSDGWSWFDRLSEPA